ncbi:MAG: hypothetical protein ABIT09_08550 [Croceibacterium sp.]
MVYSAFGPRLDPFREELRTFPFGKFDDQVDSLTQLLAFDIERRRWIETEHAEDGRPLRVNRRDRPRLTELARSARDDN